MQKNLVLHKNNGESHSSEIYESRKSESSVNTFPDVFIRIDYHGYIFDYAASSLGRNFSSANSFIGKKVDEIFPPGIINKVYESIFHIVRDNTVGNIEYAVESKNSKKFYKAKFIPSVNEQIIIILREITKSKKVKKALLNSRRRLKTVWDYSSDGMRLINRKGNIVAVNNSYCNLFEKTSGELIGKSLNNAYKTLVKNEPVDFEKFFREKKIETSFEEKIELNNGKTLYVEVVNTFVTADETDHAEDNEILLLSILRDITQKKVARQTEKLLAEIVESSHDAIIVSSLDGMITSWNHGAEKIFGYSNNEVIGSHIQSLFSEEKADELMEILRRTTMGEKNEDYETPCLTKEKKLIDISSTISPVMDSFGVINGISIIARDITDKKIIEQTLRESEERYRSLVETSPDAILLLNFEGKILMGNRLLSEMFGFDSVEEILGRNIFDHIIKNDRKRILHDGLNILETGKLITAEYNLVKKQGDIIPVEVSASIIVNNIGMPDAIISVIRDISERKLAERALKNSEIRFRSVWENSNDGMRLTDENGNIVAVNKAFCNLAEKEETDLIGKPFNIIYNSSAPGYIEESIRIYKKNFNEKKFKTHKQSKSVFNCGKTLDLDVTYSMIEFEKGKPLLLAIFHDITERKKVEEELRKSEKHAAIGKMAAYLSHEIKTPLASIKMNIDMLSKELEIPKEKQKSFTIIQREVKRLNKLLKNVLQFSRESDLVFVKINLFNLVNNICQFLKPVLDEKYIRFVNNTGQVFIKADYQKLQTVFLHLIENSIQAISNKGVIEISSSEDKKNNCVSVFIKDNGSGISLQSQIFDPFFTTKASGTGLGLSIAQKIIEQHNGKIKLASSKPGETIFEITFFQ